MFALIGLLGFGAILERRTALTAQPMTDLGNPIFAAWAVYSGENLYTIHDWDGWHYQYPPLLAILMTPFAHPLPAAEPRLAPGTPRTPATVPYGYRIDDPGQYYPLGRQNLHFFLIVAAWYLLSVGMLLLSLQALASAVEGRALRGGPPSEPAERWRWWARRVAPAVYAEAVLPCPICGTPLRQTSACSPRCRAALGRRRGVEALGGCIKRSASCS